MHLVNRKRLRYLISKYVKAIEINNGTNFFDLRMQEAEKRAKKNLDKYLKELQSLTSYLNNYRLLG